MAPFDLQRLQYKNIERLFKPLSVEKYIPIEKAVSEGFIKKDSELLLVTPKQGHQVAFTKHAMGFHHLAAGQLNDSHYLLSFCDVCNSGMVFNPEVDGQVLHFQIAGVYNGMLLLKDKESQSYWDHITGECLHGKYKGQQLESLHSHKMVTTHEVMENFPECQYGIPKLTFFQNIFASLQYRFTSIKSKGILPPGFRKSMASMDTRLPEMKTGLGIWEGKKTAKFYPLKYLQDQGGLITDKRNKNNVVVFISPTTQAPVSIYIDKDITPKLEKSTVTFSNGNYYASGKMFNRDGNEIPFTQPNQVFSRWYGFVSTFPGCEVVE